MSTNLDHISRAVEKARQEHDSVIEPKVIKPGNLEHITDLQIKKINVSRSFMRERRVITGEDHDDEYITTYKMLRTVVLHRLHQNGWNTFGVTSSMPDEGKTLTALNLSIQLAIEASHSVLLVDADLRRPSVHKYLGYTPEKGLSDYLLSGISVKEILVDPSLGDLAILPGHKPIQNSSESLSSPRMVSLVKELKARHPSQIVIFDLPPLLFSDDVIAFSPYLDAVLLVIEDGKVSHNELARSADLLKNANLLGTVLNKTQDPSVGYPHYYYY